MNPHNIPEIRQFLGSLGFNADNLFDATFTDDDKIPNANVPGLVIRKHLRSPWVCFWLKCDHVWNDKVAPADKILPRIVDTRRPKWKLTVLRWVQDATFRLAKLDAQRDAQRHAEQRDFELREEPAKVLRGSVPTEVFNQFAAIFLSRNADGTYVVDDIGMHYHMPLRFPQGLSIEGKAATMRAAIHALHGLGLVRGWPDEAPKP